jgi:hypothetical protein
LDEQERVLAWRRREALTYGLPLEAANAYAHSGMDASELRRLVAKGCPPQLIAQLVL